MDRRGGIGQTILILVIVVGAIGATLYLILGGPIGAEETEKVGAETPTRDNPVTISESFLDVSPGDSLTLEVRIFNLQSSLALRPTIDCDADFIVRDVSVPAKIVSVGSTGTFRMSFNIWDTAPTGVHDCRVTGDVGDSTPIQIAVA